MSQVLELEVYRDFVLVAEKKSNFSEGIFFGFVKDFVLLTNYFILSVNNLDSLVALDSLGGVFRTLSNQLRGSFLLK